jgi:hypothetical protein
MEYCPKGSLAAAVKGRVVSSQEATDILLAVARGVAVAHAAGIVHRDLKPQNIMVSADGTPKVADFGLAKRMASAADDGADGPTQTGAILGTPAYMAPEQAFGNSKYVGPEADVYALGATLYSLLLGQPPFVGPTPMETVLQVVNDEPKRPRSVRRDIPKDLEAICLKCLEKDRRHRYPTAAELAEDLSRYRNGEAVSAVRSGWMGRVVGAMERVPLESRFAEYGTILLALAPIMLLPEIWVQLTVLNEWPLYHLLLAQYGRIAGVFLTIGFVRKWKLLPHGPVERHLWTVMTAYVLSCTAVGVGIRLSIDIQSVAVELKLYQPFAALTGLAFFALASSFWGYCAVIGLGFFALTLVMGFDLRFAPVTFGLAWATVLVILGTRLRRIARNP